MGQISHVLVTGGAGYVGSVLCGKLLAAGCRVSVLDTFEHEPSSLSYCSHNLSSLTKGDAAHAPAVQAVIADCDAVIHLAAVVGYPACLREPTRAIRSIINAAAVVAEHAKGRPIIHASTGSVYGAVEDFCSEDTPCNPQSLYGKLKREAEIVIASAGGVNLRFATLAGMSPCPRFDLLPNNFCWRAVRDGAIVLYRGNDRRTFLSVGDACLAYIAALENFDAIKGRSFNVGDESLNMTKRQLAELVQSIHSYNLVEIPGGHDPDLRDYAVKYDRFREATGFSPRDDFGGVLRDMCSFAKVCNVRLPWRLAI